MEDAYDAPLDGIRLHTDEHAAELARHARADAFTMGRNIVFGRDRFDPSTRRGQRLIAHEVAHVVQQSGGNAARRDGNVEAQADRAATSALGGVRATLGAAPVSVMRSPETDTGPAEDHSLVVFIAGAPKEFATQAKRYYSTLYPDFERLVMPDASIEEMFEAIAHKIRKWESNGRRAHISQLHIVAHAKVDPVNEVQVVRLLNPISRGSKVQFKAETADRYQEEIYSKGAHQTFVKDQAEVARTLDDRSEIRMVSCNVGEDAELVRAIQLFFGGNANVLAARGYWEFESTRIGHGLPFEDEEAARQFLVAQGQLGPAAPLPKDFKNGRGVPTQFFFFEDTSRRRDEEGEPIYGEQEYARIKRRYDAEKQKKTDYAKADVFGQMAKGIEETKTRVEPGGFYRSPIYSDDATKHKAPENLFVFASPLTGEKARPHGVNTNVNDPLGGIDLERRAAPPENLFLQLNILERQHERQGTPKKPPAAKAQPAETPVAPQSQPSQPAPAQVQDAQLDEGEVRKRPKSDQEQNVKHARLELLGDGKYRLYGFDIGSADIDKPGMRKALELVAQEAKARGARAVVTGLESHSRKPGRATTYAQARAAAVSRVLLDAGISVTERGGQIAATDVRASSVEKSRDRGALIELQTAPQPRPAPAAPRPAAPSSTPAPKRVPGTREQPHVPERVHGPDELSYKREFPLKPVPPHPGFPLGPVYARIGGKLAYELLYKRGTPHDMVQKYAIKNDAFEDSVKFPVGEDTKFFVKGTVGPSDKAGALVDVGASVGLETKLGKLPLEFSFDPYKLLTSKEGLKIAAKPVLYKDTIPTPYGPIEEKVELTIEVVLWPNFKVLLPWLRQAAPAVLEALTSTTGIIIGGVAVGALYTAGGLILLGSAQRQFRLTAGTNIFTDEYAAVLADLVINDLTTSLPSAGNTSDDVRAAVERMTEDRDAFRGTYNDLRQLARILAREHVARLQNDGQWGAIRQRLRKVTNRNDPHQIKLFIVDALRAALGPERRKEVVDLATMFFDRVSKF